MVNRRIAWPPASIVRYSFARTVDSSERVAVAVADFAAYTRSYGTANDFYNTLADVSPTDLQHTASKYFVDLRPHRHNAVARATAGGHRAGAGAAIC